MFVTEGDVNVSVNKFHEYLMGELNKTLNHKQLHWEPWISPDLHRCIRRSKKLYSQSIKANATDATRTKYKEYSMMLNKHKRVTKKMHYNDKCKAYQNNTKKLWNVINEICGKINDKTTAIDYLKIDNIHGYNANKIANRLGSHFANVGKKILSKTSKKPIGHYLSKVVKNPSSPSSLMVTPVNVTEITEPIDKLPTKNKSGHDNFSYIL